MKRKIILIVIAVSSVLTSSIAQSGKSDADEALRALKESLEKRNFAILEPFLDPSYKVGDYPRPGADKVLPQILAQNPGLVNFTIRKKEVTADKTIVEIEYEVEGHPIGTDKSTSRCMLTASNKFLTIEFFDAVLARAKVVRSSH